MTNLSAFTICRWMRLGFPGKLHDVHNFRLAGYPPGIAASYRLSCPFTQNPFSPNSNDFTFELLRRSEQPTAVVHETICEQVRW